MCKFIRIYLRKRKFLKLYLVEDAGSYESTVGVEGPCATHIKVSLIKRLQNSQEVGTLQLVRQRDTHRKAKSIMFTTVFKYILFTKTCFSHYIKLNVCSFCFILPQPES